MSPTILHPKRIARELINLNLNLARLPVNAVDRATRGKTAAGESPLAMAFEGAEVSVKELLGGFLGDTTLLDDARLQRAKLAQLRTAMEQQATAEATHEQAQTDFEARKEQAEQKRQRAEAQAKEREQQLEREKAQAKQRVADEARRKQAAAEKANQARQERLAAEERAAELRRVQAESAALTEKERALAAEETVTRIDAAAKATKKTRKSA